MVIARGFSLYQSESLLKELAWRDYFQRVWMEKGDDIDFDVKHVQPNVTNRQLPEAVFTATTGINAVDTGILELQETGYMHNHLRMYVANIACNVGRSHWNVPAKWMYYYLRDADWASNALSWQWVAGSFSSMKYFANQENINKYCGSNQRDTFLDVPYEQFENIRTPDVLTTLCNPILETELPARQPLQIDNAIPSYLYNFYNLDCQWDSAVNANRILVLEPSFFKRYPVCSQTISFVLALADNIHNIQVYVGELAELAVELAGSTIHYKEHPTVRHYTGVQHNREWMFDDVVGYFPSFFAYWKKCEKYLEAGFA